MTDMAPGAIEITRRKLAFVHDRCALVPGHFLIKGNPVAWAVPVDRSADPIGWVCTTCRGRLDSGPKTAEELMPPPLSRGDYAVACVVTAKFPHQCSEHPRHRNRKGQLSGMVVRLLGDPPFELHGDAHAVVGWACGECTMAMISR